MRVIAGQQGPPEAHDNRFAFIGVACEELTLVVSIKVPDLRRRLESELASSPPKRPLVGTGIVEAQGHAADIAIRTLKVAVFKVCAAAPKRANDRRALARIPVVIIA